MIELRHNKLLQIRCEREKEVSKSKTEANMENPATERNLLIKFSNLLHAY